MIKLNQPANTRFVRSLIDDQPAHHQMEALEHRIMRIAAELAVGRYEGDENYAIHSVGKVANTPGQPKDTVEVILVETTAEAEYSYTLTLSANEWRTVLTTTINRE